MFDNLLHFLNANVGIVTLVAAFVAVYIYLKTRKDQKRDAASLILQEIRYAEQRVRNFRAYGSYAFTEKLLPTNSWHANIAYFVKDLEETDIDIISKFYSSAAYLDEVISTAAEINTQQILKPLTPVPVGIQTQVASAQLSPAGKDLIEKISVSIEYIYNTPTINKLRSIAKKRRYELY